LARREPSHYNRSKARPSRKEATAVITMSAPETTAEFEETAEATPVWLERAAGWALRGPLAAVVGTLCIVEVVTWAPNYLTWPWWADHDVFAAAAQAWDAGRLPYRDMLCNNFPGTIYLFWALGKLFGWGYTPGLWAADVAFVLLLGVVLLAWSYRRFGRALPAAVGLATALGYYLNQDYSQAAQRDWHAPLFAVVGLLASQAWPGRGGRMASAFGLATALAFRPHVIVFIPAMVAAVIDGARRPGEPLGWRAAAWAVAEWGAAVAAMTALWYAPIVLAGVWPEFVQGVRRASYGSRYNKLSAGIFARTVLLQLLNLKVGIAAAALALLAGPARPASRRTALVWLVALVGVLAYRPLSPLQHAYLGHPLMLTWSVAVGIVAALALEAPIGRPSARLAAVLLALGLGMSAEKPRYCNPVGSYEALAWLRRGEDPAPCPTGYTTNPEVKSAAAYEWEDYRALLDYIRHHTGPQTRVANMLRHVPAIASSTGRLSAFPAESVAWLRMVVEADEPKFLEALKAAPDAVVVWAPVEKHMKAFGTHLSLLTPYVEQNYECEARFGILEVWRRKPGDAPAPEDEPAKAVRRNS
jgi:hypothetical protein